MNFLPVIIDIACVDALRHFRGIAGDVQFNDINYLCRVRLCEAIADWTTLFLARAFAREDLWHLVTA